MSHVKLAVIYNSSSGGNVQLAKTAAAAAEAAGADVKLRKTAKVAAESDIVLDEVREKTKNIPEARIDDLLWADGIVFSMPALFGNIPADVKQFIDEAGQHGQKGN